MSKEIFEQKWWLRPQETYEASNMALRALLLKDTEEPTKDVSKKFSLVVVKVVVVVVVVKVVVVVVEVVVVVVVVVVVAKNCLKFLSRILNKKTKRKISLFFAASGFIHEGDP